MLGKSVAGYTMLLILDPQNKQRLTLIRAENTWPHPKHQRTCGGGDSNRLILSRELAARLAVHVGYVGTYWNPTSRS